MIFEITLWRHFGNRILLIMIFINFEMGRMEKFINIIIIFSAIKCLSENFFFDKIDKK